jgi:hypothetical protein
LSVLLFPKFAPFFLILLFYFVNFIFPSPPEEKECLLFWFWDWILCFLGFFFDFWEEKGKTKSQREQIEN